MPVLDVTSISVLEFYSDERLTFMEYRIEDGAVGGILNMLDDFFGSSFYQKITRLLIRML